MCQCQCDLAEHAPRRRRLDDMVHRPHHVEQDLAEQAMQVFKEWLEIRRVAWLEWRATVAQLPHFDLNDSDASDDEAPIGVVRRLRALLVGLSTIALG